MSKEPKIESWQYFCNILRKSVTTAFVFYCDVKYSVILWGPVMFDVAYFPCSYHVAYAF